MRMKFENDAIVLQDDAPNPIIDAMVRLLQRIGSKKDHPLLS